MRYYGIDRKARIDHTCHYCKGTIPAGSQYTEHNNLNKGRLLRFHIDCYHP